MLGVVQECADTFYSVAARQQSVSAMAAYGASDAQEAYGANETKPEAPAPAPGEDWRNSKPCWKYKQGKCTYGDRCKFSHEGTQGNLESLDRNLKMNNRNRLGAYSVCKINSGHRGVTTGLETGNRYEVLDSVEADPTIGSARVAKKSKAQKAKEKEEVIPPPPPPPPRQFSPGEEARFESYLIKRASGALGISNRNAKAILRGG